MTAHGSAYAAFRHQAAGNMPRNAAKRFMPANTHSTGKSSTPLECFAEREDREGVAVGARRDMLRFSNWPSRT